MLYDVLQPYRSADVGPFQTGEQVELTGALAAWVERDAPGTLRVAVAPEPERAIAAAPHDRQQRKRQDRGGGGVIDKTVWQAVKGE